MRPTFDASIRGGNFITGKVGLTGISGAATTFSTGATTRDYAILGRAYSKAQVSGGTTPTTDAVSGSTFSLADGKMAIYVWCYNANGDVKVLQGTAVSYADVANGSKALEFPEIPDTLCPFAYFTVKNASGSAFVHGTTNWNTANITIGTVVDVMVLPAQPLTAASA